MAATARDSSYQRARRLARAHPGPGLRRWARESSRATRIAHTATSGMIPTTSTSGSATSTQVSSSPTRRDSPRGVRAGGHGGMGPPDGGFRRLPGQPVDDQPGQQERHGGADVAEGQQQDEDADAELGGEHEAGRQQHPRRGLAAGFLALADAATGQQHGEHDDERVGHRRRDVGGVGVQPEQTLQHEVLRQLGGDERDVGQVPAVQQHIAVQHVPRHQQVVRLVGVLRVRAGHLQVRDEEQRHGQHGRGGGEQAAGGRPAGRPARAPRARVSPPAGAAAGSAEDFSGVPLLGTAATTSFGLGVIVASESYSLQPVTA